MPILSTIGGASLRSFGRGIEQVPAALPANTVLLYHVTDSTAQSATPGAAWSLISDVTGKYIIGTATQADVGAVVDTASGTATLTGSTGGQGNHNGTTFISSPYATTGAYSAYVGVAGQHAHGLTTADLSSALANNVTMSVVATTTVQSTLPAGTIVFRKIAPTSLNFTQFAPTGNGYITARSTHANTTFVDQTQFYSAQVTAVGAAGAHSHSTTANYYYWGTGYSSYTMLFTGTHTDHAFNFPCVIQLKSKSLKAWISTTDEPIEYGMIVLYKGNLSKLPSGWRVCNGSLGTPDMRDYALSLRPSLDHNAIIHSGNGATITSTFSGTTTTSAWQHDHQGVTTNIRGSSSYHALNTAAHSHSVTVSSITGTYTPPSVKFAFIQYKGI
jgi:hypothetical protein